MIKKKKKNSKWFGPLWGGINNDGIFIFQVNYPFKEINGDISLQEIGNLSLLLFSSMQ